MYIIIDIEKVPSLPVKVAIRISPYNIIVNIKTLDRYASSVSFIDFECAIFKLRRWQVATI